MRYGGLVDGELIVKIESTSKSFLLLNHATDPDLSFASSIVKSLINNHFTKCRCSCSWEYSNIVQNQILATKNKCSVQRVWNTHFADQSNHKISLLVFWVQLTIMEFRYLMATHFHVLKLFGAVMRQKIPQNWIRSK